MLKRLPNNDISLYSLSELFEMKGMLEVYSKSPQPFTLDEITAEIIKRTN